MKKTLLLLAGILLFGAGVARAAEFKIVPKPSKISYLQADYRVQDAARVYLDPEADLCREYVAGLLADAGITPVFVEGEKKADIILKIDPRGGFDSGESYRLAVNESGKNKIAVTAGTGLGIHYALQTLRQLPVNTEKGLIIPGCVITDTPAFPWRAFMLDESRHFHGTFIVKNLLDEMARLKMNVFHWHLVDDPGWRIQIDKYPELTEVGSKRNFSRRDITPQDWDNHFPQRTYYTKDEIKDIIEYAAVRGIRVMPEIEMPGHAAASIYAYPWLGSSSSSPSAEAPVWGDLYNVTDPKVEQFLHDVLDEVNALFPLDVIHIGGDEADYAHWRNNPHIVAFMEENDIPTFSDLQLWFINRISKYLESKGCRMMGWNEITGDNIREEEHIEASKSENLAPGTIVHFWDGNPALVNKAIDKGYDIVNSYRFFTYLDYPYEVTPLEKMYSFNPIPDGVADKDKSKILGMGCQSWGEYTPNSLKLFYQIFPRIAACAECAWTPNEDKDYRDFRNRFENIENIWIEKGYLGPQLHKY